MLRVLSPLRGLRNNCAGRVQGLTPLAKHCRPSGWESSRRAAFTLIELLVVVTIIGILAALIVPRVFGRIGGAQQAVAQQKIAVLENTIGQFRMDCGRLPTAQEGLQALLRKPGDCEKWQGPYVKEKDVLDPWDVEFVYRSPGQRNADFDLLTFGADKQEGGEDENQDIGNW